MHTPNLRSKRFWIPTVVAVTAVGVGGTALAVNASADELDGSIRDRAVAAAKAAAGPGTVVSAESSDRDDAGDREAYEVELRKADGTKVEVDLDKDLAVISREAEGRDDDRADDRDDDRDDRALTAVERTRAGQAALAAVGGGTVTDVEASDDRGVAYEVDVRTADGSEWDVDLDASYRVVHQHLDD